jgi:hypothetical protein
MRMVNKVNGIPRRRTLRFSSGEFIRSSGRTARYRIRSSMSVIRPCGGGTTNGDLPRMKRRISMPPHTRPAGCGIAAIVVAGLLLAGCAPGYAPPPRGNAQAAADTLYGWLQMVWGGGSVAYALTDSAGRTTPLQVSDSLAAAADVRALDRGWVRVISDGRTPSGAARARSLAPAAPPARP